MCKSFGNQCRGGAAPALSPFFEMASLATAFCKLGATADYPPGQNQPVFAEKQPSLAI